MMSYTITHDKEGQWRPPDIIGTRATIEADSREAQSERSGQIYILGEILTALHRQAEVSEAIESALRTLNNHIASWLPKQH